MTHGYRSAVLGMVLFAFVGYSARAQHYAPAVDQLSLMAMRYYAQSGGFLVEGLQLVFPPAEAPEGALTVTNAAGEVVASVPLQVRLWNDYPAFGLLTPVGPGSVQLNAPGDYTLAVRLGDDVIGEMAYTLTAEGGDDPFNPQKAYTREGPWRSLSYLSAPAERPEEALHLNYWTSLRESGVEDKTKIALRLRRGGTEVARSAADVVVSSPDWQYFSHRLVKPDSKAGFTLADLQSQDGSYALALLADGKPVKTYAVTVSGGQVQPSPRSALSGEPRPNFLTPRRINTSAGSTSRYFMEEVFWIEATP